MQSSYIRYREIYSSQEREAVFDYLRVLPEMVAWSHVLRSGNCHVYVAERLSNLEGVIIQADNLITEPAAFGTDAKALWELLKLVKGWKCLLVDTGLAHSLGKILQDRSGTTTRYLDDIYYVLDNPIKIYRNESVRLFSLGDLEFLKSANPDLQPLGMWRNLDSSLRYGVVAGAIIDSQIVASAFVSACNGYYADLAVYTHKDFRGLGLATAATSTVIDRLQENGKTPVWSCGEHNIPSIKTAEKLGFRQVSRRTYVIRGEHPAEASKRTLPLPNGLHQSDPDGP